MVRRRWLSVMLLGIGGMLLSVSAEGHEGPDPLSHWYLQEPYIQQDVLTARLGPDGKFESSPSFVMDATGEAALFVGRNPQCLIAQDYY